MRKARRSGQQCTCVGSVLSRCRVKSRRRTLQRIQASHNFVEKRREKDLKLDQSTRRQATSLLAALTIASLWDGKNAQASTSGADKQTKSISPLASLGSGGSLKTQTLSVRGVLAYGSAAAAAVAYSLSKANGTSKNAASHKNLLPSPSQLSASVGDNASVGSNDEYVDSQSVTVAAGEAASKAAEAAGKASALTMLKSAVGNPETDYFTPDQLKDCLNVALESASDQTKLAVEDIADTLMKRLTMKDNQLSDLRQKLTEADDVHARINDLKDMANERLNSLYEDISTLRIKLKDLIEERDTLKARLGSLTEAESNLADTERKYEDVQKQFELQTIELEKLESTIEANAGLEDQLIQACAERDSLKLEVQQLEGVKEELSLLKEGYDSVLDEKSNIEQRIQALNMQESNLITENENLKTEIKDLNVLIEDLKAKADEADTLRESNKELKDSLLSLQDGVKNTSELEKEVHALRDGFETISLEKETFRLRNFELEDEIKLLESQLSSAKDEMKAFTEMKEKVASDEGNSELLEQRTQELGMASESISRLEEEVVNLKRDKENLERTLSLKHEEVEEAKTRLQEEMSERSKDVLEANTLLKKIKLYSDEIEGLNDQIKDLNSEVVAKAEVLDEQEKKVEALNMQLQSYELDTKSYKEELEAANTRSRDLKGLLSDKEHKIEILEKKVMKLTQEGSSAIDLEEIERLRIDSAESSKKTAEIELLREFLQQQKLQSEEQKESFENKIQMYKKSTQALTSLIEDIHMLVSRLN